MPEIVISDTSCIIILEKISALHLLEQLYERIITTPEVAIEYGKPLPSWIEIKSVKDVQKKKSLELSIDEGEASAIALALEEQNALLLLDDLKARKVAQQLKLRYTGTLGIINKAKNQMIILNIKPYLLALKNTNFRISDNIIQEMLKQNNEL